MEVSSILDDAVIPLSCHWGGQPGCWVLWALMFCFVLFLFVCVGIDLWKTVKIFIQHRQGDRYLLYEELFDELLVLSAFPIH